MNVKRVRFFRTLFYPGGESGQGSASVRVCRKNLFPRGLTLSITCANIYKLNKYRGVEQLVARRAHNPEVVGSNPSPATTKKHSPPLVGCVFLASAEKICTQCSLAYETDERSSLGIALRRCLRQMKAECNFRSGRKIQGKAKARSIFRVPQGGAKR